jgi:hypothetical protein
MAETHSLAGLIKWLERPEWREGFNALMGLHLAQPLAAADVEFENLGPLLGEGLALNLMGCVLEDFLTREDDDGRNIVDDYLKRRGWNEKVPNKRYMAALRQSTMSLYEVSDIVPGRSFLARDFLRGGEPVRVDERSATHQMKPWDRLAARIVTLPPKNLIAGGVLPFSLELSEKLRGLIRRATDKARKDAAKLAEKHSIAVTSDAELISDTEVLRSAAPIFTSLWLQDVLQRALAPRRPQLRNSDGDELLFTKVHYPINSGTNKQDLRSAIDALPGMHCESDEFWNWIEEAATSHDAKASSRATGLTFTTYLDGDEVVLGNIELLENELVFSANSSARAERGQALLGPAIEGLTGEPLVEVQSAESFAEGDHAVPESATPIPADEARAAIREMMDRHYRTQLDQKIPMLGDTPRRAAKTAKGREKLTAWLKYLENQSAAHTGDDQMAGYDFEWLWEELGIGHLRK